uniref:Uncharacterized protein n=1 Tax=Arundo donax TaxID=35708 RepID=A0A0A9A0D1_ARUDO
MVFHTSSGCGVSHIFRLLCDADVKK